MFRALVNPTCIRNNKLNLSGAFLSVFHGQKFRIILNPKSKNVPKILRFKRGNPFRVVFCFVSFMRITNTLNNLRFYHDFIYGCEKTDNTIFVYSLNHININQLMRVFKRIS